MPRVEFEADIPAVDVDAGSSLLDALLERNVNAKMLCGRKGMCATCHVYVTDNGEGLSGRTPREEQSLMMLTGADTSSRLACQAKIEEGTIRVRMPEGLYVESVSELESLVGKRTTVPILHPMTGDVLVGANKIIVRSMIMRLSDTDFEPDPALVAD